MVLLSRRFSFVLFMRFSLVVIGLEGKGWMSVVVGWIKKDVGWLMRVGQHSS